MFFIDSETCTTRFMELEKTEQTKALPDTFTPKILYEFFSQIGPQFTAEIYDEETGACSISRNVGSKNVCLDIFQEAEQLNYLIKIN